jgi:acylphosphatase
MTSSEQERLEAIVSGRVQGVSFRAYTMQEALRLGLVGWVANLLDGRVQVVAEGNRAVLEAFVAFLWQASPAARVDAVDVSWSSATGKFTDFRVRH